MQDSRGIFRGACMECGEEECSQFQTVEITPFCGYCGCPATKHKKRIISEDCNDISTSENATSTPSAGIREEKKDMGSVDTVASMMLESLIPDLPEFSLSVRNALENGHLVESRMWDNFIMQTSAHYVNCPYMTTQTAYGIVGKKMFDKYPCIEAEGKKPWSKFAKALSRKIRKDRLAKRVAQHMKDKGFASLQSMVAKQQKEPVRNFTIGQQTSAILSRTQTALPEKNSTEIIEHQHKLQEEWKKATPEKSLIKFYLRETFSDRTVLLQEEGSFEKIVTLYPCFSSADYFIVEFSLMVGSKKMKEMSSQLKEFFDKVENKLDISKKYDDPLLAAWLTFEKKVSIWQTKAVRYVPIIEVTENYDEFQRKIKDVPCIHSPSAVIYIKDAKISDAAILFSGRFLSDTPTGVMGILTALLAVYYTLELNYPVQYVQAMGALGVFVLEHHYYKLGKKANDVLSLLK